MSNQSTSPIRIFGSIRHFNGKAAVRMEDVFATDIEDLWSAVSDPARLARWVAQVEGAPRPGGRITAVFTSGWEGPGRVETCEAPHHLLVTMSPGEADETQIEARLTAEGSSTRLMVEERGIPTDEVAVHGAGWQTHIEDLATYLNGEKPGVWLDRVLALKPIYMAMVGDME